MRRVSGTPLALRVADSCGAGGRPARRRPLGLLALLLLALPAAAATPAPGGRSVLVVDAEDPWRPGYFAFMTAFRATLQGATTMPVGM